MLVRFKTNLGTDDAKKIGLDHTKCIDHSEFQVDMTANVTNEQGQWLLEHGIVELGSMKGEAKAAEVHAVPAEETKAKK